MNQRGMASVAPSCISTPSLSADQLRLMANAIRALSMDAVEKANSGHPGLPMGVADIAAVLFAEHMIYDPKAPDWADRDRFILSAGHGSMLLYSLLHLIGVEGVSLDQIKNFRQFGSNTAGHPEWGHTPGVETTTGPLGQGIANSVGFALAERMLAARFGESLVNHRTYVIASDGDLMEGISQEAIAMAGHLELHKLTVLFDDNGISIDGAVSLSDSTNQLMRFAASGWNTLSIDGHDTTAVHQALEAAKSSDKPTMIACKTTIGFGSPNRAGKSSAHGSPLGAEEMALTRQQLGWPHAPFEIPAEIYQLWESVGARGASARSAWEQRLKSDAKGKDLLSALKDEKTQALKEALQTIKKTFASEPKAAATRVTSQRVLGAVMPSYPNLVSGSADLSGSNGTKPADCDIIKPGSYSGRYIHWGIREHGMAAAMNGMLLHGGVRPTGGTFLVFSDYCRPSIRLSALMGIPALYIMTHDSIGVGEDGPTHQPVEHLAALRAIPNLLVFRPADAVEVAECWNLALHQTNTPSVLTLTRQNLPLLRADDAGEINRCQDGAYVLAGDENAKINLFASGSEVSIAMQARALLAEKGIAARVISVPCMDLFLAKSAAERAKITGQPKLNVAIEAAIRQGWDAIIGENGLFIGMEGFGASAPIDQLYKHFGITAERTVEEILKHI